VEPEDSRTDRVLRDRIMALRDSGMSIRQIAAEVERSVSRIAYLVTDEEERRQQQNRENT
jgi:orotate phosphoribosyltransferase-like protein